MSYLRWAAILCCALTALAAAEDSPPPRIAQQPDLRRELLERVQRDQDARAAVMSWLQKRGNGVMIDPATLRGEDKAEFDQLAAVGKQVDRENSRRLVEIVDQQGWPTITQVGKDGAHAAWLLVQHADAEPKFQRRCLDLMTRLPKDQVVPENLAYLTDRVFLAEGRKQVYGTQFEVVAGKWQPRPLEEPDHVDQRRAQVGLSPLAEYLKEAQSLYGAPAK
ncbi:MAG: hypothetical protein JSS27_13535 [Planctomycetes bacterium]|nr:hypothetical protein [Planctomycetota bacterium]